MTKERQYGGLDYFKLAAAFLVAAIHTSPLASFSADMDFIFTRVIARVAVPFFFMVTGYFLLPQYVFGRSMDRRPLLRCLKKLLYLYLTGIFLYLPVNLYAGQFRDPGIRDFFRMVLLDGTFYHLWYLPAAVLGVWIVWFTGRRMPFKGLMGILLVLYLIGLFGDSYYGAAEQIPVLKKSYGVLFAVSSYTRNGVFYAPVFLAMGAGNGKTQNRGSRYTVMNHGGIAVNITGLILSAGMMTAEGILLHRLDLQRHDSMYIMLLPVMFFLFRLLLSVRCRPVKSLRAISTWIYLIHPLCIILVRGGAKAAGMEKLFVENSLVHYLAVCAVSAAAAWMITAAGYKCSSRHRLSVLAREEEGFEKGRAWIELSRENLARNVEALQGLLVPGQQSLAGHCMPEQDRSGQAGRSLCAPGYPVSRRLLDGQRTSPQLMPAIKADAYGHGAVLMAKELQDMGIEAFCVACVEEGMELRKNGITGDILILGYTHPKAFPLLRTYRLIQTVVDYRYGKVLNGYGKKIRVHVKIDTGMHRLGERAERAKEIGRIFRLKNLQIEGIYTHLSADEAKDPAQQAFTKRQGEMFYEVLRKLEKQGVSGLKVHLLASYGLLNYPELGGDYARVGIALYGLPGDGEAEGNCPVKLYPVLSLKARIAAVKDLYQGESAGYGLDYRAEEDRKIAVLAIGYADGLPRSLSGGRGRVLIHGQSAPVVGRICMDQTIVDITGIPGVKAGETAVVIGRSGGEEITAYEVAEEAGTITNEVLSRLGKRLSAGWEKEDIDEIKK